jgi:hypothetical protein
LLKVKTSRAFEGFYHNSSTGLISQSNPQGIAIKDGWPLKLEVCSKQNDLENTVLSPEKDYISLEAEAFSDHRLRVLSSSPNSKKS